MSNDMVLFSVVSCAGFVAFFVVIFGTIAVIRWFRHREILAMVEKGVVPEPYAGTPRRGGGQGLLAWGAVLSALGLALGLGLVTVGIGPWLLAGLIPLFIGLGLLIVYFVTRKEAAASVEQPVGEAESAGD